MADEIKVQETTTNVEVDELKEAIKNEYRTDHLTLPVVAVYNNSERDKASDLERKMILNPNMKDETIIDDKGTTFKEYKDRMQKGVMPKDAPKEALKGVGKHKIEVEKNKVIVTAPVTKAEVAIATPDLNETKTEFGSELNQKTAPVPTVIDSSKEEKK